MMSAENLSMIALCVTMIAHLASTIWWAASITRRVDHIERWITQNEHTAERLAVLERSLDHISDGIDRIEDFLHKD